VAELASVGSSRGVAVVLMTVTLMVPSNNRIGGWTDAVDRDRARRWDRLHWLRVTLLLAMGVLLATGMAE
jgi:hypothetical protein